MPAIAGAPRATVSSTGLRTSGSAMERIGRSPHWGRTTLSMVRSTSEDVLPLPLDGSAKDLYDVADQWAVGGSTGSGLLLGLTLEGLGQLAVIVGVLEGLEALASLEHGEATDAVL